MISKLPKWVEYGAFVLALVAGFVNAVGLLGFEHQSVSHLSGTATLLGANLWQHSTASLLHLFGILIAFLLGAVLSGFLLHGSTLKLGRHYDTALAVESAFIFLALVLLSRGSYYGHYAASAACGLQNALATTYSGAIIRTTHVTGIFTDLGIMLGEALRGKVFDRRKALLFLLIIGGFIVGGALGAYAYNIFQFMALLAPGLVCIVLAIAYRVYYRRQSERSGEN